MSDRMLKIADVAAQVGLSASTIYRYIAAGTFPAPVPTGPQGRRWLSSEVDGWIATQAALRTPVVSP